MRNGRFPKDHPVGGGSNLSTNATFGESEGMTKFRERGYWASCFPEGDGITFEPQAGQDPAQVVADVRECFGWEVLS